MATQVEIAEALGISERWLRQKITDGVVKAAARGQFDLATVARQYIAYQADEIARLKADIASKQAQIEDATPGAIDKEEHEARRMKGLADQAEMKAAAMRGDLVPLDQIGDAVTTAVGMMVSRMRGLPAKVAGKIGARDPAVAERTLRSEINEALESLSRIDVRGGAKSTEDA
jgi:phage terminase Nu1 subunit (DNA packaging protein)